MSDTDLHELLNEISERVIDADLLPRVEAGLRAQHRRRIVFACVATVAMVATVVVVASEVTSSGNKPTGSVGTPTPQPTPTPTTGAHSTTSVLPAFVPLGATLRHTGFVRLPRGASLPPGAKRSRESWYHLAGRRNADTIPKGGATEATVGNLDIHTGTSLDLTFVPASTIGARSLHDVLPPVSKHDSQFRRVSVDVAGNRALITIDENEHGAIRIDWFDAAGYHTIGEDRVITPRGLSGVGRAALVRMARSLYS